MTDVTDIRPLKPPYPVASSAQDEAKKGYSLGALEQLIRDCDGQPEWRARSDVAHAYYDFKQLTPEQKFKIWRDQGIDPRQTNLIFGVVNGILGQEARSRSAVTVEADDEDLADVCAVLSRAMKEAQRESFADMAVSNGYAGQCKGGLGWVEVSRASDPLDYPYRVEDRHRNEIYWDWRATNIGLKDARWLARIRWQDLDEAEALFPQFADMLKAAVNGNWSLLGLNDDLNGIMYRGWNNERRTTITRDQWLDGSRKRVKFYEIWYRVPAQVVVMKVGPMRRLAFNPKDPLHQLAVARGRVQLEKTVTRQVRMALFAGPHRLLDVGTTRRNFPYIPFYAFRDDQDRSPYGLIEGMISPQDEYNERRQRINWMLKARQLMIDSDALDTNYNSIADITDTANRPDMVAVLNPSRKNPDGMKLGNDLTLQKEQVDVMQDAKQLIQEVPRVYSTQLGNAPAGVTSGIAINSLTEQGATAMGELNDNYRFARRLVFEELLQLIVEDHLTENLRSMVGEGSGRRVIILNSVDPTTGMPMNMVKDAPVKVGLGDVPATPAYRMQEQQQLGQIISALAGDPQALAVLTPAYIEGSSLENRKQYAEDLRRVKGVPQPGDKQAQQAAQAQQEQQQQMAQQIQARQAVAATSKMEADANFQNANANKTMALADKERAQANLIATQTMHAGQAPQPTEDDLIRQSLAEADSTPA